MYKKNYAILFFFLLAIMPIFGQKKEIVKNNIKKVVVTEEKNIKGKMVSQKESEISYDSEGNTLEEINYKDGVFENRLKFEYNSDNNKTKETELDKSGKIIKTIEYKYQGSLRTERIVYDENGNVKSKKKYKYEKY
jgi:antitoxin component YwqK of YwqJK toxin-antitoxin module